jgi:hypothetical protein
MCGWRPCSFCLPLQLNSRLPMFVEVAAQDTTQCKGQLSKLGRERLA